MVDFPNLYWNLLILSWKIYYSNPIRWLLLLLSLHLCIHGCTWYFHVVSDWINLIFYLLEFFFYVTTWIRWLRQFIRAWMAQWKDHLKLVIFCTKILDQHLRDSKFFLDDCKDIQIWSIWHISVCEKKLKDYILLANH